MAFASASLYTATVLIPIFLADLMTLHAISPRFAMTNFEMGRRSVRETKWFQTENSLEWIDLGH